MGDYEVFGRLGLILLKDDDKLWHIIAEQVGINEHKTNTLDFPCRRKSRFLFYFVLTAVGILDLDYLVLV